VVDGKMVNPGESISMGVVIGLVVFVHVVVCLFLIGVILLQQGKSADLAGTFGGQGSQTAFGPRSAANLLTRLTTVAAVILSSLRLAWSCCSRVPIVRRAR
jgi:protein translocase SecG subunit